MFRQRSCCDTTRCSSTCTMSAFHRHGMVSKSKAGRQKGRREWYLRFSECEQSMLLDGVKRFGAGSWKKILCTYEFHWKRTAVDLKDKYRNILKARDRQKKVGMQSTQEEHAHAKQSMEHRRWSSPTSGPRVDMRGIGNCKTHSYTYEYTLRDDAGSCSSTRCSGSYEGGSGIGGREGVGPVGQKREVVEAAEGHGIRWLYPSGVAGVGCSTLEAGRKEADRIHAEVMKGPIMVAPSRMKLERLLCSDEAE